MSNILDQVNRHLLEGVEKYKLEKVDCKSSLANIIARGFISDKEYERGGDDALLKEVLDTCDKVLEQLARSPIRGKQYVDISASIGYSMEKQGSTIQVSARIPGLGQQLVGKI